MEPFSFESSHSAVDAIASHEKSRHSRFIAGGTNLVDLMKLHVETPDHLVDIRRLPFSQITEDAEVVRIGAAVSNSQLAHHPLIQKNFPALSSAVLAGASPQLRNLASVGGNLLQRTRCSYFRDPACACNKRVPGSGCSAIDGFNRMHAVLGGSAQCIATHASDMTIALTAFGAVLHVQNSNEQTRMIPIEDFYRLPGDQPQIETLLEPGELITQVEIPKTLWFRRSGYVKVRDRASYAFALTSAAVALDIDDAGIVRDSRIVLGGVGTVPWRSTDAEQVLHGNRITPTATSAVADAALSRARGSRYNMFKIELAKRTIIRALNEIGGPA